MTDAAKVHRTDALTARNLARRVRDNKFFHVTKTCGECGRLDAWRSCDETEAPARSKKRKLACSVEEIAQQMTTFGVVLRAVVMPLVRAFRSGVTYPSPEARRAS
jgi:hypothetical protein